MSVDTFTLEFGRWTKEIELNRNPDNDFDPQQIVEWDIEGPRFLNPDWSDLTDEQVLKEANVVYGKFGYEKAPVRLVALLTGRSGLHKFEQPFDALVDPTISSGVRRIVDLALEDKYGEHMKAEVTARLGFTEPHTYIDGNNRGWDYNIVFAHLMIAMAERGRPSFEGEHTNKFNRNLFWPGSVASIFAVAQDVAKGVELPEKQLALFTKKLLSDYERLSWIGVAIDPRTMIKIKNKIIELSKNEDIERSLNSQLKI